MSGEQSNPGEASTPDPPATEAPAESRQQLADRIRHEHLHGTGKRSAWRKALVVVLAVAACAALLWFQSTSDQPDDENEAIAVPAHATENFGFILSSDPAAGDIDEPESQPSEAVVPVVLYEDFLCPSCKAFQEQSAELLASQIDAGAISLEYRPFSFLTDASTDEYSQRAANAAVCVADRAGVTAFVTMHELLFENQPAEGGAGLSDEELTAFAQTAGADDAAVCITERTFDEWVVQAFNAAVADGVSSAPTVRVAGTSILKRTDGKESMPGPEELRLAIKQAAP